MKNKIAIIGASYLQVPLILKAKEMGLETHCFAWEDGAVGKEFADFFYPISILDKEAIYLKLVSIGINGITSIATDMAVPTISYVAQKLNLISNSYESSMYCTNKSLMRSKFVSYDILSPLYIEVCLGDYLYLENKFFELTNFPYIVKPVDRSGSRGVQKIHNSYELPSAISMAIEESFVKKCIIEEYIEGVEVSVETISWQGEHYLLAITDKVTSGAPFFVELEHHQPSILEDVILNLLRTETFKALTALNIEYGAGHSEFRIRPDGRIFIIEVGARMGGDFIGSHLVKLSTGYDYLRGVLNIALNSFEIPIINHEFFAGVYYLSEETSKLIPFFHEDYNFIVEKKIINGDLKSIKSSNDRSGYIIYQSDAKIDLH